jgi:hypothetical protein
MAVARLEAGDADRFITVDCAVAGPLLDPAAARYPPRLDHKKENGMTQTTLSGSCLCGAVKFEVTGEPRRFYHCHCSRCRKATGTGHASNLFVQPGALNWLQGEAQVRSFKVPEAERFTNSFCGTCGSRLPRQPKDSDIVLIPAGSLDEEPPLRPQARIFYASRANWSCADDGLPVYPEYAPR